MKKKKKSHSHVLWNDSRHDACAKAASLGDLLEIGLSILEEGDQLEMPFRMTIGPMTTGGFGFEKNMFIFQAAVSRLEEMGRKQGFLVFNQIPFQNAMVRILGLDRTKADQVGKTVPYPQRLIDEFYVPIFERKKFKIVHPLPKSKESTGTRQELALCKKHSLRVVPFPRGLYLKIFAEMTAQFSA